ncbi:YdcH family protein [uncultured Helicobacter sp.]|uniref:YdcH family protein n=1 Tax=uncultured Helicobacter sp. TaxID=175537 RepID=UPI00374F45FB
MFHEYRDEVTQLKTHDAHFAKIFDEHNELDDRIRRIEDGDELLTDMELEVLKKKKLRLKDEAYAMILKYRKEHGK